MSKCTENGSVCRYCFHSYVCEKFNEHKDDNNKKCHFANDHYVSADDVVEVVRCKDCKHLMFSDCYGECSKGYLGIVLPWYFCSYGERKEQKENV